MNCDKKSNLAERAFSEKSGFGLDAIFRPGIGLLKYFGSGRAHFLGPKLVSAVLVADNIPYVHETQRSSYVLLGTRTIPPASICIKSHVRSECFSTKHVFPRQPAVSFRLHPYRGPRIRAIKGRFREHPIMDCVLLLVRYNFISGTCQTGIDYRRTKEDLATKRLRKRILCCY